MSENDTKQLRTGALYIRVSTADQAELSPDAQKRLLLDYAKKNNIVISNDFVYMESVSGRRAQKRPEFQKMIATAKHASHPIDIILVWKYSRFARNQEESIVYKSMLKKDGVEVVSVSEPLIDGPFGTLIERIIEWMDEYYSIRLSGEVLRGMREKALKNGYQATPCLGYDAVGNGQPFIINEEEYRIIDYIMDQYDNYNVDTTAIARKCNDLGYRTKRGNLFERRNIDFILRNPFYTGTVIWNGTKFEGTHEARLAKDRYEKRLRLMNARRRPAKNRNVSACKHWLSGLLKCSICGATLSYTGNQACPYFQCWKYAKGVHKTSVSISVKKVETAVIDYLEKIVNGEDFTYTYKGDKMSSTDTSELDNLKHELERIEVKEQRVRAAYENEIDTLEEYKENRQRLNAQREYLTKEIASLENIFQNTEQPEKKDVVEEIRNVYEIVRDPENDYETKGMFIRTIVNQIVYDKASGKLYFDIIIS